MRAVRSRKIQALVLGSVFVLGAFFLLSHVYHLQVAEWARYGHLTDGLPRNTGGDAGQLYVVQNGGNESAEDTPEDEPTRDGIVSILPISSEAMELDGAASPSTSEDEDAGKEGDANVPTLTSPSIPTSSGDPKMKAEEVSKYIHSIMNYKDNSTFPRLTCPTSIGARYNMLRPGHRIGHNDKIKYFFALDLHDSIKILPRLMSSIVETMRYLGPEYCALSVVEGRSEDGTYEVLAALKKEIEAMGAEFYLNTSPLNPLGPGADRIALLSELRNMALEPLHDRRYSKMYASDAIVVFINDIAICPEDILELVHQHVSQGAHMTCAFDWIFFGDTFYDVWVSRSMSGNTFFNIPQDASWAYKDGLFWDDPPSKKRYEALLPLQVYSCWGGMVTLDAAPFAQKQLRFRSSEEGECYMGEPTLLAKDMWKQNLGKILAVPTVNVAYADEEAARTKARRGYVSDHIDSLTDKPKEGELVEWQNTPPGMLKCLPNWDLPSWVQPVKR